MSTNAEERWLPIAGYEGLYEISDLGRVRSIARIARSTVNSKKWRPIRERILKPADTGHRGTQIRLGKNNRMKVFSLHRLVLETFVGPCPDGMECCHNDGDYFNNRLDNLRWDTHSANMLDQVRHGTNHNTSKTKCKSGHDYTAENTYIWKKNGGRHCRLCRAKAMSDFYERRRLRGAAA